VREEWEERQEGILWWTQRYFSLWACNPVTGHPTHWTTVWLPGVSAISAPGCKDVECRPPHLSWSLGVRKYFTKVAVLW
jgi:hypothetical protein